MNGARWPEVAEVARKMIEAGEQLKPSGLMPPAGSLSSLTGAHRETCRKPLLVMASSGDLDPPLSQSGRAEIKDVRLHDARHTAGTPLGEVRVAIHVIRRILGHAQVITTRIYTDPSTP